MPFPSSLLSPDPELPVCLGLGCAFSALDYPVKPGLLVEQRVEVGGCRFAQQISTAKR